MKKMKKKISSLFFWSILLMQSTSCDINKNIIHKRLLGQWAIEEIKYETKSYKDQMYSNVLIFKEENKLLIPETFHFKKDKTASWTLKRKENNEIEVNINTSNTVFNGVFSVRFIEDKKRKLRGIVLESDIIYVKAYKLLQDYSKW
jgi:hypothetical protein